MGTRLRLSLAAAIAFLPILPLAVRLTQLQILEHRSLTLRADDELERIAVEAAPRAEILDRNGQVLAESIPDWACFIDKREIKDPAALAAKLSGIAAMPAGEIIKKYREPGRFVWIDTHLDYSQAERLRDSKIAGIGVVSRQVRFYPNGDLARGILGKVNRDGQGVSGVELTRNKNLAGLPIKFQVIRDGSGRTIYEDVTPNPPPARPLVLTIDRNIQFYAEELLSQAAEKFSIRDGVIAVENPNNGEILAVATYPPNPLHDMAVQDTYEPGSTFKLVTSAAALNEALVTPEDEFFCENGVYKIAPGVYIHDLEPEGELTLAGILAHSSNIGISKVVQRIGGDIFYRYARAFGFSNKTNIDLPGETGGELRPFSTMTKVALASAAYGYGIGVTPLQILNAYSSIANGGILWQPHIVKDESPERIRRVVSPQTATLITQMLEEVVEEGTGKAARIAGYRIAGKTGTARRLDPRTHQYSLTAYNASFVGFLPASRPRWAILVLIGDPKGRFYGAEVAAPYFSKLAERLIAMEGVSPDAPIDVTLGKTPSPDQGALIRSSLRLPEASRALP